MGALPVRRGGAVRRPPTGSLPAGTALLLLAAALASLVNPAAAVARRSILSGLEAPPAAPAKAQAPGAPPPGAQQGMADGKPLQPPVAAKRPHKMEQNGDVRVDDYYW
jgi:hypothetical protein